MRRAVQIGARVLLIAGMFSVLGGCTKQGTAGWSTCDLHAGRGDHRAECQTFEVPRGDGAASVDVFVKRLPAAGTATRQLWLLMGGVGEGGTDALALAMDAMRKRLPDVDIYTLDSNGTGHSNYLGCSEQQRRASEHGTLVSVGEVEECVAEADLADAPERYGISQDAHDLAWLIRENRLSEGGGAAGGGAATGNKEVPVFVWGGSAGSFLAQRFLVLYPDEVDGVILEGVHTVDLPLVRHDEFCESNGQRLLSLCGEDPFCSAHLADAAGQLDELFEAIEEGHCPELGLTSDLLRETLSVHQYYGPLHAGIPALIARLLRCSDEDVKELKPFVAKPVHGYEVEATGQLKFYLWICNEGYLDDELGEEGALEAYIARTSRSLQFSPGRASEIKAWCDALPRYEDENVGLWPETDTPLLLLQGALDPATPPQYARRWRSRVRVEKHQYYVEFPYAGHNALGGTPYAKDGASDALDGLQADCGFELLTSFVNDPKVELDLSCVEKTMAPDFSGKSWSAKHLGIEDLWGTGE